MAAAAPTSASATATGPSAGSASPSGGSMSPSGSASPSDTSSSLTDDQAERRALVPKAKVSWDKAAETAVKEVSGGKLTEIELRSVSAEATAATGSPSPSTPNPAPSSGAPMWAARVAASDGTVHEVAVDAVTGKVFRTQADSDQDADDKSEVADWLSKADRTAEQAAKTATDKTDGTVTAVELDQNDAQTLVWSVDVVTTGNWNKTTYDIDASNGEILSEDVDRD
ncbi:PepSY domain-containing protein [Streptomyces ziwulingensis]|uniref:PepSY domain-containing protein n=1 Tax=Streptomyces ziwulingensis TaxID=1045501 RepID=A0ABP9BR16_9ACTN